MLTIQYQILLQDFSQKDEMMETYEKKLHLILQKLIIILFSHLNRITSYITGTDITGNRLLRFIYVILN